jgi:hypothetical protein
MPDSFSVVTFRFGRQAVVLEMMMMMLMMLLMMMMMMATGVAF